jgi:biotin carboxylase
LAGQRVLMIGFAGDVLAQLPADRYQVDVIEEPGLFQQRKLAARVSKVPCLGRLLFADYVESDDYLAVADAHADPGWDAVVPAIEYGVPASALLAERYGLSGASWNAARIMCDKRELRRIGDAAGISSPEWAVVDSADALRRHAARWPAGCVLKPADRAGSVGVQLLAAGDELTTAWLEARDDSRDPLVPRRPLRRAFLLEERLSGPEFSVECLVAHGKLIFSNVTAKHVLPGRHPVELGHDLPAAVDDQVHGGLLAGMAQLVAACQFGTGMLHGEWILTEAGPALVECAARPPGDKILRLLDLAYGCRFATLLVDLLCGIEIAPPRPVAAAAVRFLHGSPGWVREVHGVPDVRSRPYVDEVVTVPPGTQVHPLLSSWDRLGYVIVRAPDVRQAATRAAEAVAAIEIRTGPAAP